MQKMPKKYYAFFTLPTLIAFAIAFFIPVPAWHLSFIYKIQNSDQFTMGGVGKLSPCFY